MEKEIQILRELKIAIDMALSEFNEFDELPNWKKVGKKNVAETIYNYVLPSIFAAKELGKETLTP